MKRLSIAVVFLLFASASTRAQVILRTFTDQAAFVAATGATNATGPLPDIGPLFSGLADVGSVHVFSPDSSGAFYVGTGGSPFLPADWYPATPGHDMCFGHEDFSVYVDAPIHSLGFELVEPNATMPAWGGTPVNSVFEVLLYDGEILIGSFLFDAPDDQLAFVGVWSHEAFTYARIVDTTGNVDDEYFGQIWTGSTPAPETVFSALVATGASVPSTSGVFTLFPQSPAQVAGRTVFLGLGSAGSFGIYGFPTDPHIPSDPHRIVDLATSIPGGTGTFTGFTHFALASGATEPYRAAFIGTGNAGSIGVYAIPTEPHIPTDPHIPSDPHRIADLTTLIPGGTGKFTGFTQLALAAYPGDPHRGAFLGIGSAQAGVYLFDGAYPPNPIQPIADLAKAIPGGTGTFTGFTDLALAAYPGDPHRGAFIGTGSGHAGVYLFDSAYPPNPILPIADVATAIPGGTGTFTGFTDLALTSYPTDPHRGGTFIGTGISQAGVYLFDTLYPPNPIQPIADLATPIPGGIGSFTGFASVSSSGAHTAFLGLGSGGQAGIYLAGALTKVIAVGDLLASKTVTGLRLGRDGLSGDHLAFTAAFSDGSEGVFVVRAGIHDFEGFFAPVHNAPVINVARAGKAVPIKFCLHGDQGLSIFAAGYPLSQAIDCDTGAPIGDIEGSVDAGASGLAYDAAADQYTYVWKTKKAWAGTCRRFELKLDDGTIHEAVFSLR